MFTHRQACPDDVQYVMRLTTNIILRHDDVVIMTRLLQLLFPVIIPSWRFFDVIAPSPRIEYRTVSDSNWQELSPRPQSLSVPKTLKHLLFNPQGNERLFLMSCAERFMQGEVDFASHHIEHYIHRHIQPNAPFQFRFMFHTREGRDIKTYCLYTSDIIPPKNTEGSS